MNAPTIITIAVMAVIVAYTVVSYRKRLTSGCCGAGGDRVKRVAGARKQADHPHHRVALIDGMHCENCAARVANAFHQEGLMAKVSLGKKRADIYSGEPLDDGRIRQIIAKAGYMVTEIHKA